LVLVALHLEAGLFGRVAPGNKSMWCLMPLTGGNPGGNPGGKSSERNIFELMNRG